MKQSAAALAAGCSLGRGPGGGSAHRLVLFLLVCAAEITAGWLLWQRRRAGAVLALALLPLEFAFWIGFALSAGPPMGLARTVLILLGWPSLRQRQSSQRAGLHSHRPP